MPRGGPRGEKRTADVIGAAVMVCRVVTDEIPDTTSETESAAAALGRREAHRKNWRLIDLFFDWRARLHNKRRDPNMGRAMARGHP
jgi:hypothetical protein